MLWASANGASWKPYQSGGLNVSGAWQIDALTRSGAEVTGIGTILTQQSQQTVTFTSHPVKEGPMCATDLDLELEITEDEQALDPGPQRAGDWVPGVAWARRAAPRRR